MIPTFQDLMLPILKKMADEKIYTSPALQKYLADTFNLTHEELSEKVPSGQSSRFTVNFSWAVADLYRAGLLSRVRRGEYQITSRGKEELTKKHTKITRAYLRSISTGWDFLSKPRKSKKEKFLQAAELEPLSEKTPDELMDESYREINEQLVSELLDYLRRGTPAFFENVVIDLLLAMGYGGSRREAGEVVGRSGDGGIDGVIKEDKLGLDAVYIQAKRYTGTVPVGHVRDFAGALMSKKVKKGVMITTSQFPKDAYDFISKIDMRIVLIDGAQLADLMIEHDIGVAVKQTYQVKRIDGDYFEDAEE